MKSSRAPRNEPGRARPARFAANLAAAVAVAVALAACGAAATPSPTGDCAHWCGNGTAQVTFGGQTVTIYGGGCYDGGSAGVDVRIGDWGGEGSGDYLTLTGYRPGGPTSVASAQPTDEAGNSLTPPKVTGSVGGTPFILGGDAVVTFTTATTGSFSGNDVNGLGTASGTFTCQ